MVAAVVPRLVMKLNLSLPALSLSLYLVYGGSVGTTVGHKLIISLPALSLSIYLVYGCSGSARVAEVALHHCLRLEQDLTLLQES